MDLSIILVNWNTRDLLAQCLDSVYANPPSNRFEVLVVDNASTDGSAAVVRQRYPSAHLLESETNVGFAAGNNLALRVATGKYLLMLNPDTQVRPRAFDALKVFMDSAPHAGAAGARLLGPDGTQQPACRPAPTLLREACDLFQVDRLYPVSQYRTKAWDLSQPHRVDVVQGTCMLLRRKAVESVGLLDEGYFMYSEEVDLCHRLRQHGWQIWWVPRAVVVHYGAQSTQQARAKMFLHLYRSKVRFFRKHYGAATARAYKVLLASGALARMPGYLLGRVPGRAARRRFEKAELYHRLLANLPSL